jgi:hypothetical protein
MDMNATNLSYRQQNRNYCAVQYLAAISEIRVEGGVVRSILHTSQEGLVAGCLGSWQIGEVNEVRVHLRKDVVRVLIS